MIATWSEWKRYPKAARGERLEAPIGPGIYEVRHASSGALFAFGAVDNLAHALSSLNTGPKSFISWFGRRAPVTLPDLPAADRVDARSPLLPTADTLRYGTVPLMAGTLAAILVALGVTAAARRIRSERAPRTPSRPSKEYFHL